MIQSRLLGILLNAAGLLLSLQLGIKTLYSLNQYLFWASLYYFYLAYFGIACLFYFLNDLKQMRGLRVVSLIGFFVLILPLLVIKISGQEIINSEDEDKKPSRNQNNLDSLDDDKMEYEFDLTNLLILLFVNFTISLINIVLSYYCTKDLLTEQAKLIVSLQSAFAATFETERQLSENTQQSNSQPNQQCKVDAFSPSTKQANTNQAQDFSIQSIQFLGHAGSSFQQQNPIMKKTFF